jgi:hypothetical protein
VLTPCVHLIDGFISNALERKIIGKVQLYGIVSDAPNYNIEKNCIFFL